MKNLIRFAMALVAAHMAAPLWAAAPPGPYFNGFENNTNGWFAPPGTIMRRHSGYTNGGEYASGINSAAGNWHARLTGDPCDHTPSTNCTGPFTNWGGYSATFPPGGYLTQVDIYLDVAWAATHPDYRFDWDSSINDNTGQFLRDFVFNAGTQPMPRDPPGFFVNASTNATRSGAFPENSCPDPGATKPPNTCRTPVFISVSGWYTFRHTFRNEAGFLAVDFDIINQSTNVPVPGAHWTIHSDPTFPMPMSNVGGNRYGWFVMEEIPDLAIDNSLRTGLCHSGDGDGEVEERDSHKMHHQHFHKNSTCGGQGGEEDNVNSDDEDSGSHFESNSVQSSTFTADEDSQAVTMLGTGTHDGLPVGFTMIAVDNGNLAPGVFTLILTDGYAFTGDLTSGTIAIH
jgi:hypothetical protein